ncbi:MAG: ABC transporter permease [Chloroflexota bacterium]|nr:ABC transporter permease [Chloroflexota bacterium]
MAQTQTNVVSPAREREGTQGHATSPRRRSWQRLRRNRIALVSLGVLVVIHVVALAAPLVAPKDPNQIMPMRRLQSPSAEYWLGTDENGRDLASRLVYGSRVSLLVGLSAMAFSIVLGTLIGLFAGFAGGIMDVILMRITDGMLSIPLFFFIITALAVLGTEIHKIVIVIGLTSWMTVARIVRGEVLRSKQLMFVEAARSLGASAPRILFRHVLPLSFPSIIVAATLGVAYAILLESSLSYLGLGVQPPTPSWGNMLSNARTYMWSQPWLTFYPGILIFLTVLLYNWLGDGLRDALDPMSSERES